MATTIQLKDFTINPALLVIDVQNGFVSKGGSYDLLGMETSNYREVIPKIRDLINLCKNVRIPIFYTQAVRESSGIDLLTRSHKILPKSREERIKKKPICVRETWDAKIVDEIKPSEGDHVVMKRRDSAFHDTEIGVVLISDATASNNKKHYESTLENVKGYYGIVMDIQELSQSLPLSQLHSLGNRKQFTTG
jgi:ureidoacrylate peracid hydrolase